MKCECGGEFSGDICMLCGREYTKHDTIQHDTIQHDNMQSGSLGDYTLDITESIRIMDMHGNTIYDIPYDGVKCSTRFRTLRIQYPKGTISLRGHDIHAWRRAISYVLSPPVWYVTGTEDIMISYNDIVLGVTPCIVVPPFSWNAFNTGAYNITLGDTSLGDTSQTKTLPISSGTHTIHCQGYNTTKRSGDRPQGITLVLNDTRSLVVADIPYLTDGQGHIILRMPGASVKTHFRKRGATISWNEPGLGKLSIRVWCDADLKYHRLQEMLSKKPPGGNLDTIHDTETTEPHRKRWWSWGRKKTNRYNRGTYQGIDITVTNIDLDTRLGRFDGYSFEAICSNLLASMGYTITKGYDVSSGRMLGPTRGDKGIDIIAKKDRECIIVQCKLWREQTGGPDVNKTLGAATTEGGTSILVISTGGFTQQAKQIARESSMKVELWDWDVIRRNIRKHLIQ